MDEKGLDTAVARLMPTLENKLATVSSGLASSAFRVVILMQ
jgi:hypothetical protein